MWQYTGQRRPPFAVEPKEGQESVWDYPRPPIVRPCDRLVVIRSQDVVVAETRSAVRVLETASPPGFYVPQDDVNPETLVRIPGTSICEWKGLAEYRALASHPRQAVGWTYADPHPAFRAIRGHLSFYPGRIACFVDDERVRPQPGEFYGGWITDDVVGPFKGEPGTGHW